MSVSDLIEDIQVQYLTDSLNTDTADELAYLILTTNTFFTENEQEFIVKYYDWATRKLEL